MLSRIRVAPFLKTGEFVPKMGGEGHIWPFSCPSSSEISCERLLNHIRYILWDEVPSDLLRPKKTYDDFLVV